MTVAGWVAVGVIGAAVLIGAVMTGKPLRALFAGALQGIAALAAVNVASAWTGVTLGVTAFSAAVCAGLGIPGAVTLLVMQVIVGM